MNEKYISTIKKLMDTDANFYLKCVKLYWKTEELTKRQYEVK